MNKQEMLDFLRSLRDSNSDEIPTEILNGRSPEKNFKVRKNWWFGLIGILSYALNKGDIEDLQTAQKAQEFVNWYATDRKDAFKEKPLTEAGDIKRANDLLNEILGPEQ